MMLMFMGMPRPTHTLCLVIRQITLGEGGAGKMRRAALKTAGGGDLGADSTGSCAVATALLPLHAGHMGVSQALEALIAF